MVIHKHVSAQADNDGLPEVINYRRTDYKGGTQNWGISQSKNGNIYFANNAGLLEFNGTSWHKYELPNHSYVRSVKVGNDGRIYVGGYNEFGYFEPDISGKLLYHSLKALLSPGYSQSIDFIWKINDYGNGIVFQTFTKAYLFDGKKIEILKAPAKFQFSFYAGGKLYFQDMSCGLLEYSDHLLKLLPNTNLLNASEIWGIIAIGSGLLVATQNKGIYLYQSGKLITWPCDANVFLKKNGCLGGVIIDQNHICFNSVLDGVIICDTAGHILQHVNQKKGLENNTILSCFTDKNNNLWLGLDNGIGFINESSPISYFGADCNLSTVYASAVYKNILYVATNQGLFFRDRSNASNLPVFKLVKGTTGQAWNIQLVDSNLLCAHNRGLLLIVGSKAAQVLDANGYWGVKKMPGHPQIMIGARYNGFSVFERNKSAWRFRNNLEGIDRSASTFELDSQSIWMIKDSLLYQIEYRKDLSGALYSRNYKNIPGAAEGITGLHFLNGGIMFQSGRHFYNYTGGVFKSEEQTNRLFKDLPEIHFLQQDSSGNFWYTANDFLGMLKKTGGQYQNIVAPFVNLRNNLVYDYLSIAVSDADNIYIGLTTGLAQLSLSSISHTSFRPVAYINSFSYPGDTFLAGNLENPANIQAVIPYASNNVQFTFSSPAFSHLPSLEFAYHLKGFDKGWSNWTAEHRKEYSNLPEGYYTMMVKSKISFDEASSPAEISFTISPPWYRRKLAYVFYLLATTAFVWYVRWRIKIKIRKNKYYETLEQRRLYLERESGIRMEQSKLEKEIEELKIERLTISLRSKDRELVNNTFQVVKKNNTLNSIIQKIKKINEEALEETTKIQLHRLSKSLTKELDADKSWNDLEKHIKNVHFEFLKRLKDKYPCISPRELDLATYLLLNMSSKEIAAFMNISSAGVELARYRLRKKLALGRDQNLVSFLMSI